MRKNTKNALIGIFSLGVGLTGDYVFSSWVPSRFFPAPTYGMTIGVESIALFSFAYWLLHKIFDNDGAHTIPEFEDHNDHRRVKVFVPAADPNDSAMEVSCDSDMLHPPVSGGWQYGK